MTLADDDLRQEVLKVGRSPVAWRMSSDALWRAASAVKSTHLRDVKEGRAGVTTVKNHTVRIAAVVFRSPHKAPPPAVAPACLMLTGLALEALAKGILVAQRPERVSSPEQAAKLSLEWDAPEHLSRQLLARAGVQLSDREGDLVDRLAMFVRWAGRYPIPKLIAEMGPGFQEAERGAHWREDDFTVSAALRDRLRVMLTDAIADRGRQRR